MFLDNDDLIGQPEIIEGRMISKPTRWWLAQSREQQKAEREMKTKRKVPKIKKTNDDEDDDRIITASRYHFHDVLHLRYDVITISW